MKGSSLNSSQLFALRPGPHSSQATWSTIESPTRGSWDICETTASSPSDKLTGPEHLQPSAKFLMRCGSSMPNLNERFPNSTRSRRGNRVEVSSCQSDRVSTGHQLCFPKISISGLRSARKTDDGECSFSNVLLSAAPSRLVARTVCGFGKVVRLAPLPAGP